MILLPALFIFGLHIFILLRHADKARYVWRLAIGLSITIAPLAYLVILNLFSREDALFVSGVCWVSLILPLLLAEMLVRTGFWLHDLYAAVRTKIAARRNRE